MKCPYCGKEMVQGYIQCRDGVRWTPKLQLVSALSFLGRDSVSLENGTELENQAVYAYNCENCKKVLIDYSESQS